MQAEPGTPSRTTWALHGRWGGENSELGPTCWGCGAGQEGRLRVLETSTDTSWIGLLQRAVRTLFLLHHPARGPVRAVVCDDTLDLWHLSVASSSRVLLQIPELRDSLHLRGAGTTPQVPICPKRHLLWSAANPSPLVSQPPQCRLPSGASSLSWPLTEASRRKGRLSCWHIHVNGRA